MPDAFWQRDVFRVVAGDAIHRALPGFAGMFAMRLLLGAGESRRIVFFESAGAAFSEVNADLPNAFITWGFRRGRRSYFAAGHD